MFATKVLRRSLIAATIVAEAKLMSQDAKDSLCRPSELPIYTPDQEADKEKIKELDTVDTTGVIEDTVRTIRQTITHYTDEVQQFQRVAVEEFKKGQENVQWVVTYLREEDNTMPKYGAIGIGALTGLIFGLRGGIIKKTLYATTGALGMAAVCYPKEASEYTQIGLSEGKKYLTIAYNFAYGDEANKEQSSEVSMTTAAVAKEPYVVSSSSSSESSYANNLNSSGANGVIKDQLRKESVANFVAAEK